ncbi:MAG: 50S ribosomal protein L35 [Patescibacteria group bacterium]
MKTNKSYTKRLRVTKNGKILSRKPGGNHYNAKESRGTQLARKRNQIYTMTKKNRARFLPGK